VMQTTNGVDACRQLKATPETAHIPVVLLPSRAPGQDESWAQKLGADDHLAKPFAPDEVMSVIRRYVG